MGVLSIRLTDTVNPLVKTDVLALWLDRQPITSWWRVDGDPRLSGLVSFPCTGREMANTLREFSEPLQIRSVSNREVEQGEIDLVRLDNLALQDAPEGPRILRFSWRDYQPENEWELIEDTETPKDYPDLIDAGRDVGP